MTIVNKKLDELHPYANNPRINDGAVDAVAKSIEQYGFKVPMVITADGEIVCGHTRYKAAQTLGLDEVPCVVADDLTPEQVKSFRLVDNKTVELAEWDNDLLKDELASIQIPELDEFDFDWGIESEQEESAKEDEYEVNPPKEPKSKIGNIYKLGRHRLMCGDSTSADDVHLLAGGAQMDMLLTDPPYGVDYTGKTKDALKIDNDNRKDEEFIEFLTKAFANADSVMKPGAVFYVWHAILKTYDFESACHTVGWEVRQVLIWVKNSMVLGRQDYQWKHEPCLYGWKSGAGHLWASDRKQTTVLEFDRPSRNAEHPTMKPMKLSDYQMCNNTKGGDCVLDLFAGSGTTLIAAEQNGRTAYCMEYDPKYIDVIIDRWEKLTGEKAVLLNDK